MVISNENFFYQCGEQFFSNNFYIVVVVVTSGSLFKLFRGSEVNHRHVANKLHRGRFDEDTVPLVPASAFQKDRAYVHAVL